MKKMEKLRKVSRVFAEIFKVGYFIMGGASAGLLILIFVLLSMNSASIVPEIVRAGREIPAIEFVLGCVGCLGITACSFFILLHEYRLCRCLAEGESPFTSEISGEIRKIAVWKLMSTLIPIYGYMQISPSAVGTGITFAFVMFCLSIVFEYGCELQKEVDETL